MPVESAEEGPEEGLGGKVYRGHAAKGKREGKRVWFSAPAKRGSLVTADEAFQAPVVPIEPNKTTIKRITRALPFVRANLASGITNPMRNIAKAQLTGSWFK